MKKYNLTMLLALFALGVSSQTLTKSWEVSGLEAPESVVLYEGAYYVSNVAGQPAEKNGKGYITQLSMDGKVITQKWATGFHAPKGLGTYEDLLYVADIDVVHVVDLKTGKITRTYRAEGATFLNDIEVSKDGIVYISDTFGGNAIYQIKEDKISMLIKDDQLDYPNGLKLRGSDLYVASWGVVTNPETFGTDVPGKVLRVSLKDQSISEITGPTGNLDGLVNYKSGFIASDWIAGKLLTIDKNGETKDILDLNAGSADITYLKKQKVLLVPRMMDGGLTAYEVN